MQCSPETAIKPKHDNDARAKSPNSRPRVSPDTHKPMAQVRRRAPSMHPVSCWPLSSYSASRRGRPVVLGLSNCSRMCGFRVRVLWFYNLGFSGRLQVI